MAPGLAVARILLVDDNAQNRALAQATLEDEDIPCVLASSGREALALFDAQAIDCILLDIRMPELDGIEVCKLIRARPDGARAAILFLTAERDVATFDRALAAGGDDFITRPFRPSELVARIQTALRLRQLATANDHHMVELKHQRDVLHRLQLQKEQLTQFLVHDFKNPVNAIQLQAQRVLRGTTEPRALDAAEKIMNEARALMRMITDLLDLGRAEEGQLVPLRVPTALRDLVGETLDELRPRATANQVSLVADIAAESADLDRDLVRRVLANLIDNAIRHAPERSTVTVSVRSDARGLELRVTDQGAGVPEAMRASVFARFVTSGDSATSRGLGLAFCRVAVEAHGGRIWIEDAAPGAVFAIDLPTAQALR
ncbi:MAG: hybrid sensor histidine kinase/response regulator [Deltaproteobacteria bacterium]